MKYEIPLLLLHGGGAIVNTCSGAGVKVFGRGAASLGVVCPKNSGRPS